MRKGIIFGIILLLTMSVVYAALTSITTTTPADAGYIQGGASELVKATGDDVVTTGTYEIDDTGVVYPFASCSGTSCNSTIAVFGALPEGVHNVTFGLSDGGPYIYTTSIFTLDRTNPTASLTIDPSGSTADTSIDYTPTCADAVSLASCVTELDSGSGYSTISSSQGLQTIVLTAGVHNFRTTATDSAGNSLTTGIETVTIDDLAPNAIVGGLTITNGSTDGTLQLDWAITTDNGLSGMALYNIYRSIGSGNLSYDLLTTVAHPTNTYTDVGPLVIVPSTLYNYKVTPEDNAGNEELVGITASATPVDNPPADPVVDATDCQNGSPSCQIDVTYAEGVSLDITSGGYEKIFAFDGSGIFNWNPPIDPDVNSTYYFNFLATDSNGLVGDYDYALVIGSGSVGSAPINITQGMYQLSNVGPYGVKSSAVANGLDWVVLGWNLSMNGGTTIRAKITDIVDVSNASNIIDVTADTQPIMFCSEDYDAITEDISATPSYNSYNVDNDYNELAAAVNCPDGSTSEGYQYPVYLKVPIPAGARSGNYAFTINFGLYS